MSSLVVLDCCVKEARDMLRFVVRNSDWSYQSPSAEGSPHRLVCGKRAVEAPSVEELMDKIMPCTCRFPKNSPFYRYVKLTVIAQQRDVIMVCDSLETFYSRAGRSYAYGPKGVETYMEGVSTGTYPTLRDAFAQTLLPKGWTYGQYVQPQGAPISKVIVVQSPHGEIVGFFRNLAELFKYGTCGKVEIEGESTIYRLNTDSSLRLGYQDVPWTTPEATFALMEKKGWRKTTPRVVEWGSSVSDREVLKASEIDEISELKRKTVREKAKLIKKLNVDITTEELELLLS